MLSPSNKKTLIITEIDQNKVQSVKRPLAKQKLND